MSNKNCVIKVENLGKQYRLGQVGTGTISHDLNRAWHKLRGKEDPYLKVGDVNDRAAKGGSDLVWSLKDINFEVQQGEVLGIIGKNGAGKSTLLKLLSKITAPTLGDIKIKGRIAALLEVGTGFHPELSGRENVFLNGAILGMNKQEISSKFDEIVDFSGVEKYIDTPVKRYSSGMMVRLGFAVAAHLEPEILIVDEVLAVGDADFQKKCLGKMKDVSGDGRTILFVSHNMTAVSNLCHNAILLDKGIIVGRGTVNEVINLYFKNNSTQRLNINSSDFSFEDNGFKFIDFKMQPRTMNDYIDVNTFIDISFEFELSRDINLFNLSTHLFNQLGDLVFNIFSNPAPIIAGKYKAQYTIPANLLNDGSYIIDMMVVEDASKAIFHLKEGLVFEIQDKRDVEIWHSKWRGQIRPTSIKIEIENKI